MKTFQLDECLNDPKFARECEESSGAENTSPIVVRRLPNRLKRQEDDVVLRELLLQDGTLLTKDRAMPRRWTQHIPDNHPGIVIIATVQPATITIKIVKKILGSFKQRFPRWSELSFQNAILEITEIGIEISHKSGETLARKCYVDFEVPGWDSQLTGALGTSQP